MNEYKVLSVEKAREIAKTVNVYGGWKLLEPSSADKALRIDFTVLTNKAEENTKAGLDRRKLSDTDKTYAMVQLRDAFIKEGMNPKQVELLQSERVNRAFNGYSEGTYRPHPRIVVRLDGTDAFKPKTAGGSTEVDYDKLAAAIVKAQQAATTQQTTPSTPAVEEHDVSITDDIPFGGEAPPATEQAAADQDIPG